ncbi:hypothetical protein QCA50_014748 [Cerrena zonata]|uniref:B-related factor 1 n=1 Tax=Cerrena zonata TaxID=2478898 RepID=A0AAW0FN88_9APHY
MTVCTDCGGTVIEYDAAAGNGFCVQCGTVLEENTIVNEVTFGETSNGAAMVQGSFVGQGATHARMGGPFGHRGSTESREQTIANATRKIQQVANAMRLSDIIQLAATRLYTLAVEHKFTRGRKSMNVVAVCLYIACRQKDHKHVMLIDFSDLLQVNVFELGHTYLQLMQTLSLRLTLVDPSHYISRFAALLEFGDETSQVALDATRLVQRFDRDWMALGRRPSGICGAALLLAARMNNFRRSVEEIVQVVKIADTTLRKRVEEFRKSSSANLSVADFRSVWLEETMDPPAFTKGRERELRAMQMEQEEDEEGEGEQYVGKGKGKATSKARGKKRKRKRGDESDGEEQDHDTDAESSIPQPSLDPALFDQGILEGALAGGPADSQHAQTAGASSSRGTQATPLFLPDDPEDAESAADPNAFIDPALLDSPLLGDAPTQILNTQATPVDTTMEDPLNDSSMSPPPLSSLAPVDQEIDSLLANEVSGFFATPQGSTLQQAVEHAEAIRQSQFTGDDELLGLNEDELDAFILTEDEVKIKERVWVELNKDYLEALAAKAELEAAGGGEQKKSRKRRKTKDSNNNRPRDASTPHGSTAAESVKNLLKKNPRYSKRINYDALKDLFTDTGSPAPGLIKMSTTPGPSTPAMLMEVEEDEDEGLYEEKSDGEGMGNAVVVEEGGGGVGAGPAAKGKGVDIIEEDGEDEDAEGSDKGEDYAEWDVYEQEV